MSENGRKAYQLTVSFDISPQKPSSLFYWLKEHCFAPFLAKLPKKVAKAYAFHMLFGEADPQAHPSSHAREPLFLFLALIPLCYSSRRSILNGKIHVWYSSLLSQE